MMENDVFMNGTKTIWDQQPAVIVDNIFQPPIMLTAVP